jgi:hypothetical protein
MPSTIIAMHTRRATLAGSFSIMMPQMTVPTVPMPVQMA